MKNPLLDTEFLRKLDSNHNRTIYAKIVSLNQYEYPIEQIEGVVTAGSISIDGESAVRRVCQLTLSAKNLNINNVYWGLTTKIKIEIGLENTVIDNDYDEIIWFKQGIFILTDFKTSQSINNYTINITGKDKMCLLNGDVAGNFLGSAQFDCYTTASAGGITLNENNCSYFNLFTQKVNNSNIEDEASDFYNDFNYSHQLNKITELFYYPKSSRIGQIQFSLSNPVSYDLSEVSTLIEGSKYLIDFGEKDIDGFIVENCRAGDKFEWSFSSKIPIQTIIENMLHEFGQERLSNIIIKDIDPFALEMVDSYDDAQYLLYGAAQTAILITAEQLITNYTLATGEAIANDLSNIVFAVNTDEDNFSLLNNPNNYTLIIDSEGHAYYVIKILAGEVAGYRMTPLVYPDTLSVNVGESITSVLDKIVRCLGQFEYFYNLDGQFVFQAKPAYIEVPWNNTVQLIDDSYVDSSEISKRIGYIFDSADMTTQYTNSPNMNNVKNDYSIWGERTTNGDKKPIHARYAIDNPPIEYTDFEGYTWCAQQKQQNDDYLSYKNEAGHTRQYALGHIVDWRHLIYVMWEDWFKHNHDDDFEVVLRTNNNWPDLDINLFPIGKTGYEQYYNDIQGFWPKLYDVARLQDERNHREEYVQDEAFYQDGENAYWAKNIIEDPTQLDFWFDFFKADEMGIGKFAVSVIGDRPKTINNSIIKVITYRDAPDVIYCTASEYEWYNQLKVLKSGYAYIIRPEEDEFYNSLVRTVRGRSAHQEAENMLYQYSFYNDNVNVTSIPIYYLNPNTLISIKDELSNIIGYYTMTKINLSLAYNGTMSISATKIPERIY